MNIFEKASRIGLIFVSAKGNITVEDLWILPLTSQKGVSLDGLAKDLHKQIQQEGELSFVTKSSPVAEELQLKFDIVKHIIDTRLAENEAKTSKLADEQYNKKIDALIAKKEDEALGGKSIAELTAMKK